ncbi:GIY-YIG nuclease family protein [Flavobacterium sp. LS1R49]|uniref:GIY-YIG nuclease family protein n=1 Tax=Flavobacterium shii TaxID=2987687 RepID=A0A9X2YWI2_9FLAO|nr:GIY-YIG nuclease family protein [Flavobacterium shii]MCV9929224.1 GIY-YIG nuclease family protein [Flavobacterium shii]
MFGKSIRIYLSDGSPSGLRHVEIANWSGQAIACPRSRFSELKKWTESQRPGVYFLLEKHSTDDKNAVYIGESENVYKRLIEHDSKKDFWNEVILFTSKDEHLTKSHIKYLESRLSDITKNADRYTTQNGNKPTESTLPRAEKDAMEEFIHNAKMILGTLGHKLLEPINSTNSENIYTNTESLFEHKFFFNVNGLSAEGKQNDEGFLLIKNSEISIETTTSIPGKINSMRNKLIEDQILIKKNNRLILTKDIILSSSSYAAALVAGTSRSGPQSWKDSNGKTLKALEESLIKI